MTRHELVVRSESVEVWRVQRTDFGMDCHVTITNGQYTCHEHRWMSKPCHGVTRLQRHLAHRNAAPLPPTA